MTEHLLDLVEQKAKEGKVVFMTIGGPLEADLEEFLKQPAEGILYDLNRDLATITTFIEEGDPRWVNDYAVGLVITRLKEYYDKAVEEVR